MHPFEDRQFMNVQTKKALVWDAVPTLFKRPHPPKEVTPKRKTPTPRTAMPCKKRKKLDNGN